MFKYVFRTERGDKYTVIIMPYKMYEEKEETIESRYLGNNKEVEIIVFTV